MDRRTRKLLRDALDAANEIMEYTQDVELPAFKADRMRQSATYYAFAVLGEAINLLTRRALVASDLVSGILVEVGIQMRTPPVSMHRTGYHI